LDAAVAAAAAPAAAPQALAPSATNQRGRKRGRTRAEEDEDEGVALDDDQELMGFVYQLKEASRGRNRGDSKRRKVGGGGDLSLTEWTRVRAGKAKKKGAKTARFDLPASTKTPSDIVVLEKGFYEALVDNQKGRIGK
jgi:hypothetical protein